MVDNGPREGAASSSQGDVVVDGISYGGHYTPISRHDTDCETELTSHGYTPCRCAERRAEDPITDQTPLEREYPHFEEIYNLVTGKDGRVMTDPTPLEQARSVISRIKAWREAPAGCEEEGHVEVLCDAEEALLAATTPEPARLSAEIADMIAWMSEARDSHRHWAEHLEAHAASGVPCAECDGKPYKLSSDGEREWERRYTLVLRALAAPPHGTDAE